MPKKDDEKRTFESAMARLDEIVKKMESGEMDLDTMIAAFEEGQELVGYCSGKLNEVEARIEKIVGKTDQEVAVELFESDV